MILVLGMVGIMIATAIITLLLLSVCRAKYQDQREKQARIQNGLLDAIQDADVRFMKNDFVAWVKLKHYDFAYSISLGALIDLETTKVLDMSTLNSLINDYYNKFLGCKKSAPRLTREYYREYE